VDKGWTVCCKRPFQKLAIKGLGLGAGLGRRPFLSGDGEGSGFLKEKKIS